MSMPPPAFRIAEAPFAVADLQASLEDPHAGACVTFEGRVRDHHQGRAVAGLRYEVHAALAEAEGARIVADALLRFDCVYARCVHRSGVLVIGELAVWVGVSAAHRDAAFAACRHIIDEVKARVPIWKHERYADGDAGWVHALGEDT